MSNSPIGGADAGSHFAMDLKVVMAVDLRRLRHDRQMHRASDPAKRSAIERYEA